MTAHKTRAAARQGFGVLTWPGRLHSRWQAGRRGKPALYFGRCPNCRCTRLHRDEWWAEASVRGWTIGVCW